MLLLNETKENLMKASFDGKELKSMECDLNKINSRIIAESFGKNHKEVLRDIRVLISKNKNTESEFLLCNYTNSQNKKLPQYQITDNGYLILQYKYKFNIQSARFELKFKNELIEFLKYFNLDVISQYIVCDNKYRIDFYIPKLNIAIEYDEIDHKYKKKKDNIRQTEIENKIGCNFIRIDEELSIGESLGIISKYINKVA